MIEQLSRARWDELDFAQFGEQAWPEGEIYAYLREGKILGWYLVERNQTHVGPFEVLPEHRGNGIGGHLALHAIQSIPHGYVAALNETTEKMCEKLGLIRVQGSLWTR